MNTHPSENTAPASGLSRRRFLQRSAMAAAATATAFMGVSPSVLKARSPAGRLETTAARLGFIALTDAAPLFVALEKGFFAKHGMTNVEVLKQSSWGSTRDNLVLGSRRNGIDGAHILSPMPYFMSMGTITSNNVPVPISLVARMNLSGQCISVSDDYAPLKVGLDASEFGRAAAAKRTSGQAVNAAHTFPGGTHDMWIRYWLAAGGINPDRDINTITVPPAQMVANMRVGSMEAFCVSEPWHKQLINQRIGYTACITGEIWHNHPEKAFALRSDYIEANPRATQAILMAVMEAQMFCDDPANVEEVARICSRRRWVNAPFNDIIDRARGHFDYGNGRLVEKSPHMMRYWKDHASYPFQSHDLWFLTENQRWGMLPPDLDTAAIIKQVNREDLWRSAAEALGVDKAEIPTSTSRGPETFFDGKVFDPANPKAYLDSLAMKRI